MEFPFAFAECGSTTRWGVSDTGAAVAFIPVVAASGGESGIQANTPMPSGITLTVGGAKAIRFLDELSGNNASPWSAAAATSKSRSRRSGKMTFPPPAPSGSRFALSLRISGAVSVAGSSHAAVSSASSGSRGRPTLRRHSRNPLPRGVLPCDYGFGAKYWGVQND